MNENQQKDISNVFFIFLNTTRNKQTNKAKTPSPQLKQNKASNKKILSDAHWIFA